jgi:hypothetical protein
MTSLSTIAQGSERPILTIVWTHADNTTGEDLTGATITGYIKDLATGNAVEIQGTFAITDAANGVFTWTPDPLDVATDGAYQVQFSAVFAGEPTPARTAVFEWEIVESIIPTDPPTEVPDHQGVVKLLARTTDPDNPATGYWGMYVKSGGMYLIDESGAAIGPFSDGSALVAVHVAESDPHTQYLTEAAAASTYSASGHTHAYAADPHTHDYAASGHDHDVSYATTGHTHAVTRFLTLGRTDALTATVGTQRLYVTFNCTIVNVAAWVGTAPTGADVIFDIHKNGATLFSTQGNRPTIAAGTYADLTNTPDVTAITAGDFLTLDVDTVGSIIAGSDAVVTLEATVP